ncbi:MAG: hypothetical protein FWE22_03845 [Firmicutes bacterium]|nr:hypothetical protein [Bacillota bacterium]
MTQKVGATFCRPYRLIINDKTNWGGHSAPEQFNNVGDAALGVPKTTRNSDFRDAEGGIPYKLILL